MIKVCLVRGKYLNNYEGQNYIFDQQEIKLTAVSSLKPINNNFPFPVKKFPSPSDIPYFKGGIKFLCNRLIGDQHLLMGLEKLKRDFDIFHTADSYYYYSYQLARLRKRNFIKKLIVTSWETKAFNNESVWQKKRIKYFTLKNTDHFICYTKKAKSTLMAEGVDSDKISTLRAGVDLTRFKLKVDKLAVSYKFGNKKNLTILFVGRLVEEKGILDLYEAYKEIKKSKIKNQNYNLKLKIVGDGYLKNRLKDLINNDDLEESITIEKKEYEEMPEVYREADILILPSKTTKTWEEQYGMVLVEAMAIGLPIVAYDSGAISEIVGNCALVVDENNIDKLTISIKHLIENKDLRSKLGKMGRARAEKEFDAKKTAKKISNIYKSVIRSKRIFSHFIILNESKNFGSNLNEK